MEVSDGESATILMGVHYYFGHRENLMKRIVTKCQ